MGLTQVEQRRNERSWPSYLVISLGLLFIVLSMAAPIYFREEIQRAQSYGFVGVFLAGILEGITLIPFPTLWLVFTLGHVLNPAYVGLTAGLGGAVGGMTIYLTGAGVETIWSKLRVKEEAFQRRLGLSEDMKLARFQSWMEGKAIYNRLTNWLKGKRGSWVLFIASATVISPLFYPASLVAGSLGMGLARFFLISWAGKTVKYLIIAFVGNWGLEFILKMFGI